MSDNFAQIVPNGMRHYKNNPNLKGEGVSFVFTKEQIEERIKCTQDPIYFIEKYMKIVHVDRGLVPFELYDFQKNLLRSYIDNRFTIAKLPRQVGKSTVTISYILWTVLFGPMQNIAILANKAATARDILAKLQLAYEFIPLWMQQGIVAWNKGSIELENGSKVIAAATASSAARGSSYNCVSGDSIIKVKLDGIETEIAIAELYNLIANSDLYEHRTIDNKETQYVHREQVQKTIHQNYTKRLLTSSTREIRKASHHSSVYGRNKRTREFGVFTNKAPYCLPQTFDKICDSGVSKQHHVCLCHDDTHQGIQTDVIKRISNLTRLASRIFYRKKSFSRNPFKDFSKSPREIQKYTQNQRTSSKYLKRIDWAKEKSRTCCQDQQESRENTQNGRKTSGYETVGRIQTKNESSGQGSYTMEQGEEWNLLFNCVGQNAGCQEGNTSYGRAQREFKKIQVLTEAGYKDFHGIKKTKNQDTLRIFFSSGAITCTPNHKLFTKNGYIEAKGCLGEQVLNYDGTFHEVVKIEQDQKTNVYDLLEVSDTHSYYCNGYLTHQCIFLDEFAFVPKNIAEEFITSVYPTISSGKTTKVIMVSTPNGMNLFYKYWTDAVNKRNLYVPIEAHYSDVPGRDEAWAEDQKKQLGEEKFKQEFLCDFIGSANTLISGAKLSSMAWVPPIERMSSLAIYEQPREGRIYMICADVAEGKDLDYSAFVVVDSTEAPYKVVARYYDNKVTPLLFPNIILHTANKYNRAYVMVETNSVGAQVVDILHNDLEYENIFATTNMGRGGQKLSSGFGKNSKFGVKMTNQIKLIGCSNLKGLLENDKILIEDFDTISELTSFVSTNTSFGAEEGCHDDLVMCLVLFAWLSVQPTFKEITDSDVRKRIFDEQVKNMNDQVLPFGYIEDGADRPETFVDSEGDVWESVGDTFNFGFSGGKAIRKQFDDDF